MMSVKPPRRQYVPIHQTLLTVAHKLMPASFSLVFAFKCLLVNVALPVGCRLEKINGPHPARVTKLWARPSGLGKILDRLLLARTRPVGNRDALWMGILLVRSQA